MNSRNSIPARPTDSRRPKFGQIVVGAVCAVLAALYFAAAVLNHDLPGLPSAWFGDWPAQVSDSATVEQPSNDFGARS